MLPICGHCSHFTKDEDYPTLFGSCEFKEPYVSFRATACQKWNQAVTIDLDLIKKFIS